MPIKVSFGMDGWSFPVFLTDEKSRIGPARCDEDRKLSIVQALAVRVEQGALDGARLVASRDCPLVIVA